MNFIKACRRALGDPVDEEQQGISNDQRKQRVDELIDSIIFELDKTVDKPVQETEDLLATH